MPRDGKGGAATGPALGSNSLDEVQRQALFFEQVRKRMAANARIAAAQKEKKEAGKIAQSYGIVLGDLDFTIRAMEAEDKKTITDRFASQAEILAWLNYLPGFQADMFNDRMPAMEKIRGAGKLAGLAALERVSGYAKNSNEDVEWLAGYDEGQAIMRDNLQGAMEKAAQKGLGKMGEVGQAELIKTAKAKQKAAKPPKAPKPRRKGAIKGAEAANSDDQGVPNGNMTPPKPPAEPVGFGGDDGLTNEQREAKVADLNKERQRRADFH